MTVGMSYPTSLISGNATTEHPSAAACSIMPNIVSVFRKTSPGSQSNCPKAIFIGYHLICAEEGRGQFRLDATRPRKTIDPPG
jgi:hypothetical protein